MSNDERRKEYKTKYLSMIHFLLKDEEPELALATLYFVMSIASGQIQFMDIKQGSTEKLN